MLFILVMSPIAWALTAGPDGARLLLEDPRPAKRETTSMRDNEDEHTPRASLPALLGTASLTAAAPVEDGGEDPARGALRAPESPQSVNLRDKFKMSLLHAKSFIESLDARLASTLGIASSLRTFAREITPETRMLLLGLLLMVVGVVLVASRMHSRRSQLRAGPATDFGTRWTNRQQAHFSRSHTSL